MAEVDIFVGRINAQTKQPVTMRLFNLQDLWAVHLDSGNKHEELNNLTYSQAQQKWESNKKWWS